MIEYYSNHIKREFVDEYNYNDIINKLFDFSA